MQGTGSMSSSTSWIIKRLLYAVGAVPGLHDIRPETMVDQPGPLDPDYYDHVPRERRILGRGAHVLFQRDPTRFRKTDSGVLKYFKDHPRPAPARRASVFGGLARSQGRGGGGGGGGGGGDGNDSGRTFHLPPEITHQILSYFSALDAQRCPADPLHRTYCALCYLSNLYNIALVSRSWNGPATEVLYSTLKLSLDGVCEFHHRGLPWGDGVVWWARRTSYLSERYLKPLLRTLQARPQLARLFRTLEIDMHHRLSADYRHLALCTRLLELCTGLARVLGDPCVFFAPVDPYLESVGRDVLNYVSRGTLYRGKTALVLAQQKRLWRVLAAHDAWVEWTWVPGCMHIQVPAFRRFHVGWQALRHLEIRQLHFAEEEEGGEAEEEEERAIACLGALESLALKSSAMRALRCVPTGRLAVLSVEVGVGRKAGTLLQEFEFLWAWLAADAQAGSKLRSLDIATKCLDAHGGAMDRWLPRTLALVPGLRSLRMAMRYRTHAGALMLEREPALGTFPSWPAAAAFPPGVQLRKLVFLCPGWAHHQLLLGVLRRQEVWPALGEVEYCTSVAVTGRRRRTMGARKLVGAVEARPIGAVEDGEMEMELFRRGMAVVARGAGGGGGDAGEAADVDAEAGWVRMRRVGWQ